MPPVLRPEILTPSHTQLLPLLAFGLGAGLIGAGMMFAAQARVTPAAPPPPAAVVSEPVAIPVAIPVAVEEPVSSSVHLVFRAGGATYMKLAEVGEEGELVPRHGAPQLREVDYAFASIAPIALEDVPAVFRGWEGKAVLVDGTCTATVQGFDVVARLTGDPGYADTRDEHWTAASVMANGMPVIAARLDGCADGTLAVDAARRALVMLAPTPSPALEARAKELLLASSDAKAAQHEWADTLDGTWHDNELVTWAMKTVQHPQTRAQYVSVHATVAEGCGGPNINVWHLYRVEGDTLVRVPASLEQLSTIDGFVDIEGDGELEVLGHTWTRDDTRLIRADGELVDHAAQPFYGCAC